MQYRKEIDGLRAVAVLPVIFFHAGFPAFSGGFVGVDVFFVISGYLITGILLEEMDQGRFSILRFYERRARRILPALFTVVLFCFPFAWAWMPPDQLRDFAKSVVAVVLFSSNVLFWQESGYFDTVAELKPLLHTWSLAVEEQFYIVFPLFLLAVARFGRVVLLGAILFIALISLLLSEWASRYAPSGNFFLAPTRAWELLAGSTCAIIQMSSSRRPANWLSVAGLALILFSIFYYDERTPFPSAYALVPVFGTVLVLLYGSGSTWTARMLSQPLLVGIGLISYSAYLWHQPLFAFARLSPFDTSDTLMLALSLCSLALGFLSWKYVETPFRRRPRPALPTRPAVFATSAVAGAAMIAAGAYVAFTDVAKTRFAYASDSSTISTNPSLTRDSSRRSIYLQTTIRIAISSSRMALRAGKLHGSREKSARPASRSAAMRPIRFSFGATAMPRCSTSAWRKRCPAHGRSCRSRVRHVLRRRLTPPSDGSTAVSRTRRRWMQSDPKSRTR